MKHAKILAVGGVIAVVAATAILVPSIASGEVFTPPGISNVDSRDGDGSAHGPGNGDGKAWGHNKDSEDFPGNNGQGRDKNDNGEKSDGDSPGNGNGNAWGHNKDSEDFPGNNGNGHGRDKDDKPGKSENSENYDD